MIFDLVKDFGDVLQAMPKDHPRHRILKLLDEAIRRDVHFIDRHPTTFFQCMWNTCWWYDCPEAAEHYERPASERNEPTRQVSRDTPAKDGLEAWKIEKEKTTPGFLWLRALRPPRLPLGCGERAVLQASDAVTGVAVSSDRLLVAASDQNRSLHFWDSASGKPIRLAGVLHGTIFGISTLPNGIQIIASFAEDAVHVWNIHTSEEVGRLRGHQQPIMCAAFSPDGKKVVTGSNDRSIRTWDLQACNELLCIKNWVIESFLEHAASVVSPDMFSGHGTGHEKAVFCVEYTSDGRHIVSGSADNTARVFDAETGDELLVMRGHQAAIYDLAVYPDGERVVTASEDKSLRVWNLRTGNELFRLLGHETPVTCVAVAPHGNRIVSGSADGMLHVWDADSGTKLLAIRGHQGSVQGIVFSQDGATLISGSADRTVRLWDSASVINPPCRIDHKRFVNIAAFDASGSRIVTGAFDRTLRVWDVETGIPLLCVTGRNFCAHDVAFSLDGRVLACRSSNEMVMRDFIVQAWDTATGEELIGPLAEDDSEARQSHDGIDEIRNGQLQSWVERESRFSRSDASEFAFERSADGVVLKELTSEMLAATYPGDYTVLAVHHGKRVCALGTSGTFHNNSYMLLKVEGVIHSPPGR